MRRDNPRELKLQAERDNAEARLNMLCKGIGHSLGDGSYGRPEEIRQLIELVNSDLLPAVDAAESAFNAYKPYWGRRRRRYYRPRRKKTPKTANAKPKARKRRAGGNA